MHSHPRLKFLGGRTRTAFVSQPAPAPEPVIAPAALYGDSSRVYTPGPVLAYDAERGVCLFREAAAEAVIAETAAAKSIKSLPLWMIALQGAVLLAALAYGAIVPPGASQ